MIENKWPINDQKIGQLNKKFNWRYRPNNNRVSSNSSKSSSSESSNSSTNEPYESNDTVDQNRQLLPIGVIFDKKTVFDGSRNIMKNVNEWKIKYWKFVDLRNYREVPVFNDTSDNNNDYFVPLPDFNHVENEGERCSDLFMFIGQSNTGKTTIQKIWMFLMQLFLDENRFKVYIYLNSIKYDEPLENFCEMNGIDFTTFEHTTINHRSIKIDIKRIKEATIMIDDITGSGCKFNEVFKTFIANRSSSKTNLFCSLQTAAKTGSGDISHFKIATRYVVFTARTNEFEKDISRIFYRDGDTDKFITENYFNAINDNKEYVNKKKGSKIITLFYPHQVIVCSQKLFGGSRHLWYEE